MENIVEILRGKKWKIASSYLQNNDINMNILVDKTNNILHYLVYHSQNRIIKSIDYSILNNGLIIPNIEGDTVCHIAAKLDNIELIFFFANINLDIIYLTNTIGYTPLFYLVKNIQLIKNMASTYSITDHYLDERHTLIEYYIMDKNLDMAIFLINKLVHSKISANVICNIVNMNMLNESQKISLIKWYRVQNIDINNINVNFLSPLIIATKHNYIQLIQYLIINGADINYAGPENKYHPLTIAIKNSNNKLIKLFLENNIQVSKMDKYLRTPAHYLFQHNSIISVENKMRILSRIRNINTENNNLDTILGLLILNDDWKIYRKILIWKKLKIFSKNREGKTPFDFVPNNEIDQFLDTVYLSYIIQLQQNNRWVDPIDCMVSELILLNDDYNGYKPYIMHKIVSGQSYPFVKKDNMIKFIIPQKVNMTHFSAYTYNYICFLYYILDKYPDIKIPSLISDRILELKILYDNLIKDFMGDTADNHIFRSIIRDYLNHSTTLINHILIWKNSKKYFISPNMVQGINETTKKYPDTKYILIKLTILTDNNFNHANMIIYDMHTRIIERFDPYGYVPFYDNDNIDNFLSSFTKKNFPNFTYVSPKSTIGDISFQIFSDESNKLNYIKHDPNGFCMAWCLWYVETRRSNINIGPQSLIKRTIKQINKNQYKFKNYIRNYSQHLDSKKNIILSNASVPTEYWYSLNIPFPIYKDYLKYIRNLYRQIT